MKNTNRTRSNLRNEMLSLHQRMRQQHSLLQKNLYTAPATNNFPEVTPPPSAFKVNAQATPITKASAQPNVPLTFADHLNKIDQYKGKYRDTLLQLLAVVYAACTAYDNKSEAVKKANKAALEAKCADLKIDGKSYYQLIVKLAFGDDAKRASGFVHVIKVAENQSPSVSPDDFITWLTGQGGIQQVRTKFNSDGTEKTQASKTAAEIIAEHISKAKDSVLHASVATIPYGQLPAIAKPGNEGECLAILRQQADGCVVIKLVLNDSKMVNSIYAAHGRTLK